MTSLVGYLAFILIFVLCCIRNEDAERDCTTVLALSALNAKALFRRGQARLGMGNLDEALLGTYHELDVQGKDRSYNTFLLVDLTQASKREPANESIKEELKKVEDLIAKRKSKFKVSSPKSSLSIFFFDQNLSS